jgi:HAD superfamily hydrolase (TIGR01509 family)
MPKIFSPDIRYIYFDFDNVLATRAENRAALVARMLNFPDPHVLRNFYFIEFHHDSELERRYLNLHTVGEEISFYRDLFKMFADRQNIVVTPGQLQSAAEAFVHVPLTVQPGATDCLVRLQDRFALGIFTNGLPSRHAEIESSGLVQYFQDIVISSDYRLEKPALELYRKAVEIAGVPATQVALVDDEPANIIGAKKAGFGQAVLFTPAFWQQAQ